jgi:hypothetical protein
MRQATETSEGREDYPSLKLPIITSRAHHRSPIPETVQSVADLIDFKQLPSQLGRRSRRRHLIKQKFTRRQLSGAAHVRFACAGLDFTATTARTASPAALEFCISTSVSTTEQTRISAAASILLRCSHATSTAEKSGPSRQNRGVYRPVSLGSKKSVQSPKVAPPYRALVEYGLRGSAFSTDTASSCFCLSSLA